MHAKFINLRVVRIKEEDERKMLDPVSFSAIV